MTIVRIISNLFIIGGLIFGVVPAQAEEGPIDCQDEFVAEVSPRSKIEDIQERLKERQKKAQQRRAVETSAINTLTENLQIAYGEGIREKPFFQILKRLLAPMSRFDSDLVVNAILGAGAIGKSQLFNLLVRLSSGDWGFDKIHELSKTDPSGRQTVRPHVAISKRLYELGNSAEVADAMTRYPNSRLADENTDFNAVGAPAIFSYRPELDAVDNLAIVDMPNFTGGDPRIHEKPEFQDIARDTLLPADVFFIMFNDVNVNEHELLRVLAENFKLYGQRHIVLILRTPYTDQEALTRIRKKLLKAARIIYDIEEETADVEAIPEGVLGMYAMPEDPEVYAGRKHPELKELTGSIKFKTLLRKISERSFQIRGFTSRSAGQVAYSEVKDLMGETHRRQYLLQIYTKIVEGALEVVPTPEEFPFEKAPRLWLKHFARNRNQLARWVSGIAGFGWHIFKALPWINRREPTLEDLNDNLIPRLKIDWAARMSAVSAALNSPLVEISMPRAMELRAYIRAYNKLFPNAKLNPKLTYRTAKIGGKLKRVSAIVPIPNLDGVEFEGGQNPKDLVRSQMLSALHEIATMDEEHFPLQLNSETVAEGMISYLIGAYKNGVRDEKLIAELGGLGIAISPISAPLFRAAITKGALMISVPVGLLVSNAAHVYFERQLLKDMAPNLNAWFRDKQAAEFVKVARRLIFTPIGPALQGMVDENQVEAFQKIQGALKDLGVGLDHEYPAVLSDVPMKVDLSDEAAADAPTTST